MPPPVDQPGVEAALKSNAAVADRDSGGEGGSGGSDPGGGDGMLVLLLAEALWTDLLTRMRPRWLGAAADAFGS